MPSANTVDSLRAVQRSMANLAKVGTLKAHTAKAAVIQAFFVFSFLEII